MQAQVINALTHNIVVMFSLGCMVVLVVTGQLPAVVILPFLVAAAGLSAVNATGTTVNINHKNGNGDLPVTQIQNAETTVTVKSKPTTVTTPPQS